MPLKPSAIWTVPVLTICLAGSFIAAAETMPSAQLAFEATVQTFLDKEKIAPRSVRLEFKDLGYLSTPGAPWQSLANVFVDDDGHGGYVKALAFDREYWLAAPDRTDVNHRLEKVLWHEIHHLNYFPNNLRRAEELAMAYPPRVAETATAWKRRWIVLQEPLEELAAERAAIQRYQAAFGPLPDEIRRDSENDMLRHAARYRQLLSDILTEARDPQGVLQRFPSEFPITKNGDIPSMTLSLNSLR